MARTRLLAGLPTAAEARRLIRAAKEQRGEASSFESNGTQARADVTAFAQREASPAGMSLMDWRLGKKK